MAIFSTETAKMLMPRTVAQLSGREPMKFGNVDYIVFNDFPRAEFVTEGAEKSATTGGFTSVTATPKKAQVTMRFNEEVQWADEDHQLNIISQLAEAGSVALSRALDLGLYHRINPLTGTEITAWDNYVGATEYTEELSESVEADQVVRAAAGLLINRDRPVSVNGFAIDPRLTWELSNLQTKNADGSPSGTQRYPNLGLGAGISSFLGINTAQGDTVSGRPAATTETGVRRNR
ncbi:hypothetical protein [Auritidibacter ignavus]|uniref:hypothetical protein n=1 Tax=Auritidibacter ignavus TaxID=678932 RepID=UPI002FE6AE46